MRCTGAGLNSFFRCALHLNSPPGDRERYPTEKRTCQRNDDKAILDSIRASVDWNTCNSVCICSSSYVPDSERRPIRRFTQMVVESEANTAPLRNVYVHFSRRNVLHCFDC